LSAQSQIRKGTVTFIGYVETAGTRSQIKILNDFCEGLNRLEEFSHIIILYWFHLRDDNVHRSTLKVIPRRHPGAPQVGVFASRSPSRPNPIGLSVVRLKEVDRCTLTVEGLDALIGSPIIDIKPYIPRADSAPEARVPEWTYKGPST